MKLSTAIVAGVALVGAAAVASAASATTTITVSEAYDYGLFGGYDQVTFEVDTPVALNDLSVSGQDFGSVGAGSYFWHGGDPFEFGNTTASVFVQKGSQTASGSFADIYGDLDFQTGMQQVGTLTLGGGAPEPANWALMVLGFGGIGGAIRAGRKAAAAATA